MPACSPGRRSPACALQRRPAAPPHPHRARPAMPASAPRQATHPRLRARPRARLRRRCSAQAMTSSPAHSPCFALCWPTRAVTRRLPAPCRSPPLLQRQWNGVSTAWMSGNSGGEGGGLDAGEASWRERRALLLRPRAPLLRRACQRLPPFFWFLPSGFLI